MWHCVRESHGIDEISGNFEIISQKMVFEIFQFCKDKIPCKILGILQILYFYPNKDIWRQIISTPLENYIPLIKSPIQTHSKD